MKPRAFALPIALLVLVGCGSTAQPAATQDTSPAAVVISSNSSSSSDVPSVDSHGTLPDADFIKLVRDDVAYYAAVSPDLIVRDARMMCGIFTPSKGGDADVQFGMSVKVSTAIGIAARDAGAFLVYATTQYCPREASYIPKS